MSIENKTVSEWLDIVRKNPDPARTELGFSEDMKVAHNVLFRADISLAEKELVFARWLQSNQPCMFGRIAAKQKRMHYCILQDADLQQSDEYILEKIQSEVKLWKHRALLGGATAEHGFLLLIVSESIAIAKPDESLKAFSEKIRSLWIPATTPDEEGNDAAFEELYLRNPKDGRYYKFTFTADYFASAGDKRWWHDHRIPGGIGFSANSLGHMLRCLEWYDDKPDTTTWGLKEAMHTIASSAPHKQWGHATWLLDVAKDHPQKHFACPFSEGQALPKMIQGKDWTAYGGLLHTDHSIRAEFFNGMDEPSERARPYLMDFTYIYNTSDEDYTLFMGGQLISKNEIDAKIGTATARRRLSAFERSPEANVEIELLIKETEKWELSDEQVSKLLEFC